MVGAESVVPALSVPCLYTPHSEPGEVVATDTMVKASFPQETSLDSCFFRPTPEDWAFLRSTVSNDDDEIKRRAFAAQLEAYEAFPYPCLRVFEHIKPSITLHAVYTTVLEEAKMNPDALFLDLACCMGTDARKLVLDGVPASRVIASDIQPEFIEAGYTLFNDRATNGISFLVDDMLKVDFSGRGKPPSQVPLSQVKSLNELKGRMTYIYASNLFHLFDEKTQREISARFSDFLRVPAGGVVGDAPISSCVIFGRSQALESPAVLDSKLGRERFAHSPESWTDMWRDVFEERHGSNFAKDRLRFTDEYKMMRLDRSIETQLMYWSVRIM